MAQPPSTTDLVPLKDIKDNLIFLTGGALRSILDVSAVNFELRSSEEQVALLQQFQNFLNSVDFNIQIVIQSRSYDIAQYLKVVKTAVEALTNDMLRIQAEEYIRYVEELSSLANIMTKKFYIVIPLEVQTKAQSKGIMETLRETFTKKKPGAVAAGPTEEELEAWRTQLAQRAELISGGLLGMGLKSKLLEQQELTTLFTALFSPEVPTTQGATK